MVAITNVEHFTALNTEQMRPQAQPQPQAQEEVRHIGAGNFNPVTKTWQDEDITPEANAEAESHGAGSWDVIRKCWI